MRGRRRKRTVVAVHTLVDAGPGPLRNAAAVANRCDAVTFWGFTDAHSWIDSFFAEDDPLLFDEVYAAKPAFFGVEDALLGR